MSGVVRTVGLLSLGERLALAKCCVLIRVESDDRAVNEGRTHPAGSRSARRAGAAAATRFFDVALDDVDECTRLECEST